MENCKTGIETCNEELPFGDILSQRERQLLVSNKRNMKSHRNIVQVPVAEVQENCPYLKNDTDCISKRKKVKFLPSCEIIPLEDDSGTIPSSSDRVINFDIMDMRETELLDDSIESQMENLSVLNGGNGNSPKKRIEACNPESLVAGIRDGSSDLENDVDFNFTVKTEINVVPPRGITAIKNDSNVIQSSLSRLLSSDNMEKYKLELLDSGSEFHTKNTGSDKKGSNPEEESETYYAEAPVSETLDDCLNLENDFKLEKKKRVKFVLPNEVVPIENEDIAIQSSSNVLQNSNNMDKFTTEYSDSSIGSKIENKLSIINERSRNSSDKGRETCNIEHPVEETLDDSSYFENNINYNCTLKTKLEFNPSRKSIDLNNNSSVFQGSLNRLRNSDNVEKCKSEFPGGKIQFYTENELLILNEGSRGEESESSPKKGGETYNEEVPASETRDDFLDSENDTKLKLKKKKRVNFVLSDEIIPLEDEDITIQGSSNALLSSDNMEANETELQDYCIGSQMENNLSIMNERSGSSSNEGIADSAVEESLNDSSDLEDGGTDNNFTLKIREKFMLSGESKSLESNSNVIQSSSDIFQNFNKKENCKLEMEDGNIVSQMENILSIVTDKCEGIPKKGRKTWNVESPFAKIPDDTTYLDNSVSCNVTVKKRVKFVPYCEIISVDNDNNIIECSSDELLNSDKVENYKTELQGDDTEFHMENKHSIINKGSWGCSTKENEACNVEAPVAETREDCSDLGNDAEFKFTKKKKVRFIVSNEILSVGSDETVIHKSSIPLPNSNNTENAAAELSEGDISFQIEKISTTIEESSRSPKKENRTCNEEQIAKTRIDSSDLDNDIDFNFFKKKKKKKVKFVPSTEAITSEIESNVIQSSSDKPSYPDKCFVDGMNDYSYDYLLTRAFNMMREKNPNLDEDVKKKLTMKPPQVVRAGAKKTSFANFLDICKLLHRTPQHLQSFLLSELGTNGSVDGNNQLVIKGKFQQKQIENVLRRYIREYVTCHTCRSPNTLLQRDTRLCFLQCEECGSRCSVASIKSGFQAVINKRAAIRAKAV